MVIYLSKDCYIHRTPHYIHQYMMFGVFVMYRPSYLFWVRSIEHRALKELCILMMVNGPSDRDQILAILYYFILGMYDYTVFRNSFYLFRVLIHRSLSLSHFFSEIELPLILFILCDVVFVFAKYLSIHQCFMGFDSRKPFLSHHFRLNENRVWFYCGIERMHIV